MYITILVGGTSIFTTLEILHYHEAFLVSGVLALIAFVLFEPPGKGKPTKGLFMFSALISIYLVGLKLPAILLDRLNYYLTYFLVVVLIGIVNLVIFVLVRNDVPSSRE